MKAKITLHFKGDREAIKCIYFEITHGDSMKANYTEYKNNKIIETEGEIYKTELTFENEVKFGGINGKTN